jgi:carboxymethylenebutenolidase
MQSTTTITTRDGQAPAHLFQPALSGGPWPAVIVYMDARGVRPALFELAERVASAGYFVLLPDLFYRAGPYDAPSAKAFSADPELRQLWLAKYVASASPANVLSDTEAA